MAECLRCARCFGLEKIPKGDKGRLHIGQWGMVARGLVYCQLLGSTGYKRFRSVESKDECKCFEPELNQELVANRFKTVQVLRASFDQWIQELRNKHNNGRTRG